MQLFQEPEKSQVFDDRIRTIVQWNISEKTKQGKNVKETLMECKLSLPHLQHL